LTHGAAQPSLAQPDQAQPISARAHLAPVPSPCAPPLPWSFPLIQFSRATTSSSPTSLSPRGALGFGDGDRRNLDPRGELPSPPFSSLSLFLFHPFPVRAHFLSPACAPPCSPSRAAPLPPRRGHPGPGVAPPRARLPCSPARRPGPPSRVAPSPPARRPSPGGRPLPSAAWTPGAACAASHPPFSQRVPACAAPRAR
jgi:hypothetical protein